jgi:hypothetical protein
VRSSSFFAPWTTMSFTTSSRLCIRPSEAQRISPTIGKFKRFYDPTWRIDHLIGSGDEVVSEWSCAFGRRSHYGRIWEQVARDVLEAASRAGPPCTGPGPGEVSTAMRPTSCRLSSPEEPHQPDPPP